MIEMHVDYTKEKIVFNPLIFIKLTWMIQRSSIRQSKFSYSILLLLLILLSCY